MFLSKKTLKGLALSALLPAAISAHSLWLNATAYSPQGRGDSFRTTITFGYGHRFPLDDFLNPKSIRFFDLIKDGEKKALEVGEGGFLATPLTLSAGAYTVSTATNTGLYTMYREGGRLKHLYGGMEGLTGVVTSLYYEQYAKAFISAGETDELDFTTPVGHNIEIVPQKNPYSLRAGDILPLKVYFEGKPLSFCQIDATYIGFSEAEDFAFSTKTGSGGDGSIRLLQRGTWIVFATLRRPPGEEYEGRVREEKYTASITFNVQ